MDHLWLACPNQPGLLPGLTPCLPLTLPFSAQLIWKVSCCESPFRLQFLPILSLPPNLFHCFPPSLEKSNTLFFFFFVSYMNSFLQFQLVFINRVLGPSLLYNLTFYFTLLPTFAWLLSYASLPQILPLAFSDLLALVPTDQHSFYSTNPPHLCMFENY